MIGYQTQLHTRASYFVKRNDTTEVPSGKQRIPNDSGGWVLNSLAY